MVCWHILEKIFGNNIFKEKKRGGGKFENFFCKYVQGDRSGVVWHIWGYVGIGSGDVGGEWEREGVVGTSREMKITSWSLGVLFILSDQMWGGGSNACWIIENTKSANSGWMAEYLTLLYFL